MLFAEEKSNDSKGIVYSFDKKSARGNEHILNGPSYKEKNGQNCPNPGRGLEYRGDLLED